MQKKVLIPLLLSLTPLIFFPLLNSAFQLPKYIWIFFVVVIMFGICIKDRLCSFRPTFIVPVGLLFIWYLIVLTRCINIFAGVHGIFIFILFITLYISLEGLIAGDRIDIEGFIRGVVIVSVIVSLYGLLQVAGIDFIKWEIRNSALSTLGRRNFAGEYLVMVIPYVYYLIGRERKKSWLYGVLLLLVLHLILTFTRASYIAFFVSGVVFFVLMKGSIKMSKKVVIFLICLLISQRLYSGIKTFEIGTIKSRFLIWKVTVDMIKANPLMGVGPENFVIKYPYYGIGKADILRGQSLVVDRVHNDYLEVCVEAGVPGLLLFLYFLYTFFRVSFILYRDGDRERRLLISGIVSSVVAICINGLASFPFKNPSTLLLFWADISLVGGLYRKSRGERQIKVSYPLLKGYFLAFVITGLVLSYRGIQASRCVFFAKNLKNEQALLFAEKSVVYNPFSSECTFIAAKVATKNGKYESAYKYLLMEKKLNPYFDGLYNNLGMVYFYFMRFKEAEESFLYSLTLNPFVADVYNNLGVLYLNTERYNDAISCFNKAISLKPDSVLAYFNSGLAYYLKNDHKKAEYYLKKTLEINPDFEDAKRLLSEIRK